MRAEAPAWPPKARQSSDEHRQPFRRRIDGGGEPGGAGADDDDVEQMRSGSIGPTRPMQRASACFGRVAQQLAARAQHDRKLGRVDVEALDQRPGAGIARPGRGADGDGRCASGNSRAAARRHSPARPMITGPPTAVSSRPTRRRIRARMIRSPSSASATSKARSRSGGMTSASTSALARRRRPARGGRKAGPARPGRRRDRG